MCPYRLSLHTHVCMSAEGAVFLDLKHDAYFGIAPDQMRALAGLVEGWAHYADGGTANGLSARAFAESLCARGLLVRTPEPGREVTSPQLPSGRAELMPWEHMRSSDIRLRHVFAFFRALVMALVMLHAGRLESTVARFQQRRQRRAMQSGDFDLNRAQNLVCAYHYIRTWVFARRGRCLLDSLTMLYFLTHFDVWPHWAIGVQLRPFAAHSWIQEGEWLLNGTPEFVRAYTPILVV